MFTCSNLRFHDDGLFSIIRKKRFIEKILEVESGSKKGSVNFAGNGYGSIFTILPALAVCCTGKGRIGVSSRLHWAIRLGLGTVSTLELYWP